MPEQTVAVNTAKSILEGQVIEAKDPNQLKKDERVGKAKGSVKGNVEPKATYTVVIGPGRYGDSLHFEYGSARTPAWELDAILWGDSYSEPVGDKLWIDVGQDWAVVGLDKILNKLRKRFPKEA